MAGSQPSAIRVTGLDHIVINVTDVARSARWYAAILGAELQEFDPGGGKARRIAIIFGQQKINLRPVSASKAEWFTADHEAAGSDDICFLTTASPQEVVAHLERNRVPVIAGPVQRQGARGTLRSVYCRDPDGSLIEIASYNAEA
ncbi:MAG TPA: VOC family protein [Xanthobacteraceae bacterium]|nr:VOC family protein [Xanthobacteraceae bacterium]